jgi:hypothetical protein
MAALKINLADDLRTRAQARALEEGFDSVEQYIEAMVVADLAGPAMSDDELEALLLSRIDGPTVIMDADDFKRIRQKFQDWCDQGRPESGP